MKKIDISREEIISHLNDIDWLKALVLKYFPDLLRKIVKDHYCHWDEACNGHEESTGHYPHKGVWLYSYQPLKPKYRNRAPGSAFPGWTEKHNVYLLETGQFATVEHRSSLFVAKSSFLHDESFDSVETDIKIWTDKEIKGNEEKIADAIIDPSCFIG